MSTALWMRTGALLFTILGACSQETKLIEAPTQVTLSVDVSSEQLRQRVDSLKVTVSRLRGKGDGALSKGDWSEPVSTVVSSGEIVQWPLDLPVIPGAGSDDTSYFEVIVDARNGEAVLAQTRCITRFIRGKWLRFPLSLEVCGQRGVCEQDDDCHGTKCSVCFAGDRCAPVIVTDPQTLPMPDVDASIDPANAVKRDAGADAAASDGRVRDTGADAQQQSEETCKPEGALRCVSPESSGREKCERGKWVTTAPCEGQAACVVRGGEARCVGACDSAECDENATCSVVAGEARCQCKPDYVGDGKMCTFDESCAALSCDSNAECVMNGASRECRCKPGYMGDGKTCTNVDECKQMPPSCDANATCTDSPGSFTCVCKAGYSGDGKTCTNADECASNPCQHGGRCMDAVGEFKCDCEGTGYTGDRCETDVNDCTPSSCMNGGKCMDAVNGFVCDCAGTGFVGKTCNSNVDDCASNPCMHGGKCTDGVQTTTCDCAGTGYTGNRCEKDVDDCMPNPCKNGGRCTDGVNDYTCTCPAGYMGDNCEIDINECARMPCQNGGRCNDGVNGYECECAAGYGGTNCETDTDRCSPNPCMRSAACTNLPNDFRCNCPTGWGGKRCEIQMNPCGDGMIDRSAGEDCDLGLPGASNDRWHCSPQCRSTTFYTYCGDGSACEGGTICGLGLMCTFAPCSAASDCMGPSGVGMTCVQSIECRPRCRSLGDCPPRTFCDPDFGVCAGYKAVDCATEPRCPTGSLCDSTSNGCVPNGT